MPNKGGPVFTFSLPVGRLPPCLPVSYATGYCLVSKWAYQHSILAVELKNSAKITLHSFNNTAVFLHNVMV